jgi:hypothetical protein
LDERNARVASILARLPGGPSDIEWLSQEAAERLNEEILDRCCDRRRVVASFADAFREPFRTIRDDEGWSKLYQFFPEGALQHNVYVITDLYGFFRVPLPRASELLGSELWSHEVYVVAENANWLVGYRNGEIHLQGDLSDGVDVH